MASRFAPSLFMHLLFTHRPPAATRMLEKKHSVLCLVKDKRGRRAASSARGEGGKTPTALCLRSCWELELSSQGPMENAANQLSVSEPCWSKVCNLT